MRAGDRVMTPGGPGTVVYVRMAPPTYTTPSSVSVRMDKEPPSSTYVGTIWQGEVVKPLNQES